VTGTTPCPICGGEGDCRTHSDEAFACCVQRPSDWRLSNGGWLHRLDAKSVQRTLGVSARRPDYASSEFGSRDFGSLEVAPPGVIP